MPLDYHKNTVVQKVTVLPEKGTWVPISIASQMADYSDQMIRHLAKNRIIRSIRFKRGPILVNFEEIGENWVQPLKEKEQAKKDKREMERKLRTRVKK